MVKSTTGTQGPGGLHGGACTTIVMVFVTLQLPFDAVTENVKDPGTGENTLAGTGAILVLPGGTNPGGPVHE